MYYDDRFYWINPIFSLYLVMAIIYQILNIITNDCYIGSTSEPKRRKYIHYHKLKQNKHHSIYLQRAYNKYGIDSFKFNVLAKCPDEYKFALEQWFINTLQPKYNYLQVAGNSLGYKHTPSSIAILKNDDKTYCSKLVYQYDINGVFIKQWNSCSEFARHYNVSRIAVIKAIKKLHKCRGYIVSYNPPTL